MGPDAKVLIWSGLHSTWARPGAGLVRLSTCRGVLARCGVRAAWSSVVGSSPPLPHSPHCSPALPPSDMPAHWALWPEPGHRERRWPLDRWRRGDSSPSGALLTPGSRCPGERLGCPDLPAVLGPKDPGRCRAHQTYRTPLMAGLPLNTRNSANRDSAHHTGSYP